MKINMPFSFWNSVGNKLLEALEAVFTTHSFRLIFSNNNNSTQEETRFLQTIPPEPISKALILMTGNSFANPNAKLLNHLYSRLPVIFLDRYIPSVLSHYVGVDNHDIGFQATRYLLQKGHSRIGFASHSSQLSTCHDRCGGYLAALMQFGLPIDHQIVIYRRTDRVNLEHIKSLGQKLGEEILALEDMPTAWVCASDKEAVGLIDFFLKQGYAVPDDTAVIGCDNDEFLLHDKDYILTTFEYPYSEIAHEIYQLTGALTATPTLPYKKIVFAAKFVQGDTA